MKNHIYQALLSITFLFRIMVPIGNAAYLMCLLSSKEDKTWVMVFVASILSEVAVLFAVAMGFTSPRARRLGAYGTYAVAGVHFAAFLALYLWHPEGAEILMPLYMILLAATFILMLYLAYESQLSAASMPDPAKKESPDWEALAEEEPSETA